MDLHHLTGLEAAEAIRGGQISPVELMDHYLDRIDRHGDRLGAFTQVAPEIARTKAKAAEVAVLESQDLPPLHGVPIAIKDLTSTTEMPTSFGSAVFRGWTPPFDDDVVGFLAAAGTISLGKTNAPEFGLACYTENRLGPPAVTPYDTGRSAGGSSGGAAAAVAAGLLPFAHGTDGGGSIRIPAAVCGLVGLKTSRARISRGPVGGDYVGISVHGPITRTTADAAALLDAMAVHSPSEPYFALPAPADGYLAAAQREPGRLRIGVSLSTPVEGVVVDPEVRAAYDATCDLLADLGHDVVGVELAFPDRLIDSFLLMWSAMAAATPLPPGGEDLLMPISGYLRGIAAEAGAVELSMALTALQVGARAMIRDVLPFDAVLTPTVALPPRPVGWFTEPGDPAEDFRRQMAFTPWAALANLTGQPAVTVPLHWSADGLPLGMQFVGRPGREDVLLALSSQLERVRPWADRHPPVWFEN